MRIPNDEWLAAAKGTAVGQQRRIRHRQEGRDNMIVGNTSDRWWAYCQACRAGGVESKTHVFLGGPPPKESNNMTRPTDARLVADLLPHERDALTLQLARKGMDWMYFDSDRIEWSESRHRLLVHTPGDAVMGRDTSERSPQKWLTYDRQHYLIPRYPSKNILLVEDTYSYYKVAYACRRAGIDATTLCTLGTSIHDQTFLYLLRNASRVWSFYDGDAAGYRGCNTNMKRLNAAGIYGGSGDHIECAPYGMDPKDMNLDKITQHVASLLAT